MNQQISVPVAVTQESQTHRWLCVSRPAAGAAAAGGCSAPPGCLRRGQGWWHPEEGKRGPGGMEGTAGCLRGPQGEAGGHRRQIPLLQHGSGPHALDGGCYPADRSPGKAKVRQGILLHPKIRLQLTWGTSVSLRVAFRACCCSNLLMWVAAGITAVENCTQRDLVSHWGYLISDSGQNDAIPWGRLPELQRQSRNQFFSIWSFGG